jgi:uncharacterized LabA/DUF88 family protein
MAFSQDTLSMAVFCDFENVALGVRDAKYERFDLKPVLERLLLKGSIVVKKAYCDWDRYKGFKAALHEANFELIEIPHVRQSGKNSADIRLVVDALDLCYTKSHVNTFVIISGDSDFSPLVSKLRENAKQVIGVGVKQSTSDLLIANCDEFIFYDDLVKQATRRSERQTNQPRRTPDEERLRKEELEARRSQAIEMAMETLDALLAVRGESGKIWASMLKEAMKRRKPDFSESFYGFKTFGMLLEEAQTRGLLEVGRDDKSGTYVSRSTSASGTASNEADAGRPPRDRAMLDEVALATTPAHEAAQEAGEPTGHTNDDKAAGKPARSARKTSRGRGGRKKAETSANSERGDASDAGNVVQAEPAQAVEPIATAPAAEPAQTATTGEAPAKPRARKRPSRKKVSAPAD